MRYPKTNRPTVIKINSKCSRILGMLRDQTGGQFMEAAELLFEAGAISLKLPGFYNKDLGVLQRLLSARRENFHRTKRTAAK